jgi:hypothetical protein
MAVTANGASPSKAQKADLRAAFEIAQAPDVSPTSPIILVIAGSSNAAGMGSSTYTADPTAGGNWASPSTSWAGLLAAALGSSATVYNRSISGSGTTALVSRFWTDIAVHNPTHVIICPHPRNDSYDYATIIKNIMLLCEWCDRIGAVPILRGLTPDNTITAAQYQGGLAHNAALDALGRHRIDHLSTFDDGTGKWVAGTTWASDGLHPQDPGYSHLYNSIDLGMFQRGQSWRPQIRKGGTWSVTGSGPAPGPGIILSGLGQSLRSWTMRLRIKPLSTGAPSARSFFGAARVGSGYGTSTLRVRNPNNVFETAFGTGAITTSAVSTQVVAWNDVVMTYNQATNNQALYVNGSLIGQAAHTDTATAALFDKFHFFGRDDSADTGMWGYAGADAGLWSVPLSASEVRRLYAGDTRQGSLLFYSDLFTDPPAGGLNVVLPNQVANGVLCTSAAFGMQREF